MESSFDAGYFNHYNQNPGLGILDLQNRVTQNDVTLRVISSKVFTEMFRLSY